MSKIALPDLIVPEDEDLIKLAIVVNEGNLNREQLGNLVAMAQIVIHRLRENNDIKKSSSFETL